MREKDVRARIRKLLRLAKSPEVHEAESAARKAGELMARHGITEVGEEEDRMVELVLLKRAKRLPDWCKLLLAGVADVTGTVGATRRTTEGVELIVVGQDGDARRARWLFNVFSAEVERLVRYQRGQGSRYLRQYRMGCGVGIGAALGEAGRRCLVLRGRQGRALDWIGRPREWGGPRRTGPGFREGYGDGVRVGREGAARKIR